MIMKQLRAAAAAASVVFAVGAGAQDAAYKGGVFTLWSGNNGHTYALEQIAGTGMVSGYPVYAAAPTAATATSAARTAVEAALGFAAKDEMRPFVVLETRAAGGIPANSKGLITFTLTGAKFATAVRNSDLVAIAANATPDDLTGLAAPTTSPFEVLAKTSGGGVGDSSVTFDVQTGSTGFDTATPASTADPATPNQNIGSSFVLQLPALKDVSPHGVTVTASTDRVTTNFPVVDMVMRTVGTGDDAMDKDVAISARVIPRAVNAVTLTLGDGTDAEIDLENRMGLKSGDKTTSLIHLGSVTVGLESGALQSDGKAFDFASGGAGFVDLTVSGVDATDVVFLDTVTANKRAMMMDTGEGLAVSAGMAENDFALGGELMSAKSLYLMVDGKRILTPGTLKVMASVSFRSGVADLAWNEKMTAHYPVPAQKQMVEMRYAGTSGTLPRAYAIAPASSGTGDISNVRVRCDDSSDCQIYFACSDQDGMDVFGKVSEMIPARATMVFRDGGGGTAMDLRDVFGEDAWMSGRLSCDVIAPDRNVEVQVLTRAGGVLVNNTYVSTNMQ